MQKILLVFAVGIALLCALAGIASAFSYSPGYAASSYLSPRMSFVIVPAAGAPYYSTARTPYSVGTIYLPARTVEPLHEEKTTRVETRILRETPRENLARTTTSEKTSITHRESNGYTYRSTSTQETSYQQQTTAPRTRAYARIYAPSRWRTQEQYNADAYTTGDSYTTRYYYEPRFNEETGAYDWRY